MELLQARTPVKRHAERPAQEYIRGWTLHTHYLGTVANEKKILFRTPQNIDINVTITYAVLVVTGNNPPAANGHMTT